MRHLNFIQIFIFNHLKFIFILFSQRDNEAKNADDVLFDMFRNENTNLLPVGKFLAVSVNFLTFD